jgi:hypothetical protein
MFLVLENDARNKGLAPEPRTLFRMFSGDQTLSAPSHHRKA